MKKIILICAIFFNMALNGDTGSVTQFTQFVFPLSSIYKRASEICKEKEFSYFLIKEMSYKDQYGQTFLFKGISEVEGGILLSETITEVFEPPVGPLTTNFELFFFKKAPSEPLAIKEGVELDIGKGSSLDQFQHLIFPMFAPHYKSLEMCQKQGFSHYIIKKISYKDRRSQILEFKGISKANKGIALTETITEEFKFPVGVLTMEFEAIFFRSPPEEEPLAIGFTEFFDWILTDNGMICKDLKAEFKNLFPKWKVLRSN